MKNLLCVIICFAVFLLHVRVASASTLVFDPAVNDDWYGYAVRYGRGIELKYGENKGNIYTTCEYLYYPGHYGAEHFPIFESTDRGKTYRHVGDVYDTEFNQKKYLKNGDGTYSIVPPGTEGATGYYDEYWGMTFQPTLYELPENMGKFKQGTVFCVGTTHSDNHSAIVLYSSTDGLKNWEYISTIAEGGALRMGEGSAIWEGFLVYEKGELYCFYSDERGMTKDGGQRLVYQKTSDGYNWSEKVKVCDFEEENPAYRPGMPIVTKTADGKFFLIYEGVNMGNGYIPCFYKVSGDISSWASAEHGTELPRLFSGGSPYCATLADGKIVIGSHGTNKIGINTNNAATNEWIAIDTDVENAYSRALFPLSDGGLLITSGGPYDGEGARKLTASVVDTDIDVEVKPVSVTGTTPWGENEPNYGNDAAKAADGDPNTFFDGLADGYVVLDLGGEYNISAIGYTTRFDFGFRMEGGTFYASRDAENWDEIHKINKAPTNGIITYEYIDGGKYRYIKYVSDGEEACNVAEIKVYASDETRVKINGKYVANAGAITGENGETLLPLRLIAEEAGADIAWIDSEKSAAIILNGKLSVMRTGTDSYVFDGSEKTASSVIRLTDGAVYVPTDVMETAIGGKISVKGNTVCVDY